MTCTRGVPDVSFVGDVHRPIIGQQHISGASDQSLPACVGACVCGKAEAFVTKDDNSLVELHPSCARGPIPGENRAPSNAQFAKMSTYVDT